MDREKMNNAIAGSKNALEAIYRAGYRAGYADGWCDINKAESAKYAVNVLEQLANILRGEIKDRGPSSYIADGLWIALREIDELKEYIEFGGDEDR